MWCLLYIFLIIIGCATLYYLSIMNITVYNLLFNCNCRILATDLNNTFTQKCLCFHCSIKAEEEAVFYILENEIYKRSNFMFFRRSMQYLQRKYPCPVSFIVHSHVQISKILPTIMKFENNYTLDE